MRLFEVRGSELWFIGTAADLVAIGGTAITLTARDAAIHRWPPTRWR